MGYACVEARLQIVIQGALSRAFQVQRARPHSASKAQLPLRICTSTAASAAACAAGSGGAPASGKTDAPKKSSKLMPPNGRTFGGGASAAAGPWLLLLPPLPLPLLLLPLLLLPLPPLLPPLGMLAAPGPASGKNSSKACPPNALGGRPSAAVSTASGRHTSAAGGCRAAARRGGCWL
jgi:hypothetical protein